MMRKLALVLVLLLAVWTTGFAETIGDVNGDGTVGIPEAINALQVVAGLKTAAPAGTYDFREYFYQDDAEYYYWITRKSYSDPYEVGYPLYMYTTREIVNDQNAIVGNEEGYQDFYSLLGSDLVYLGYRYLYDGHEIWNNPPRVLGTTAMQKGDVFATCYNSYDWEGTKVYYCTEYTILGLEDVTVPAGTFEDCLKIARKNSGSSAHSLYYYARNIGLVKNVYVGSADNYRIEELESARIGDQTYPQDSVFSHCSGTWTTEAGEEPSRSGSFSFRYALGGSETVGTLILEGFNENGSDYFIYMTSDDGIHFSDTGVPSAISSNVTIDGNTITGTFYTPDYQGTLNGTCTQ